VEIKIKDFSGPLVWSRLVFGLTRWSKLLFLAYCSVMHFHKSDEHNTATYIHNREKHSY